ncbi:hypothetical protein NPIL_386731 [Nephila pilipes]|uniref:Transmembrane protein n=1 Tax=Nephila pilipes TaxID=299642 RepID=A0A8X6NAD4_NEPPI|nr:hypothetical protein NPIL_386731 [Nephila pilipes]
MESFRSGSDPLGTLDGDLDCLCQFYDGGGLEFPKWMGGDFFWSYLSTEVCGRIWMGHRKASGFRMGCVTTVVFLACKVLLIGFKALGDVISTYG